MPVIVAAPFSTTLVQRFRGDRVLTALNVLRSVGAVATAIVIAAGLPVELTFVLAAFVAGAGSLVRPIQSALLPAFARTPGELVAANVTSSTGEGVGTFAGPSNPLFAPLPLTALQRLAESLAPCSFEHGDVPMRKGEPGDHYLLIANGEVEVRDDGRPLRSCGPGEGVGEIALLRRVPRTATVVAQTRVEDYAIDAPSFLSAVAGPTAAGAAESVVSARLEHSRTQNEALRDA